MQYTRWYLLGQIGVTYPRIATRLLGGETACYAVDLKTKRFIPVEVSRICIHGARTTRSSALELRLGVPGYRYPRSYSGQPTKMQG